MKKVIKRVLRRSGYEIRKYTSNDEHQNLIKLLKVRNVRTVLDVGANVGQYSTRLRTLGYQGVIHSFEPLPDAFKELSSVSSSDAQWLVHNHALGNEAVSSVIHRSENSYSSSILPMQNKHLEVAPQSRVVEKVNIDVKKLDDIFDQLEKVEPSIFLKIDTQGFEKNVLDGATETLEKISAIQMEMSLVPLYENEWLFYDLLGHMATLGFELYQLIPGLVDNRDGRLLQVDGVFVKSQ